MFRWRRESRGLIVARLVKRFRTRPYAVIFGGETRFFCGCGLSATQPFCDGTHKITEVGSQDELCWYDADKHRHVAVDDYPGIRSDAQVAEAGGA
jgi:CDGSH-type Zn-finger protein